MVLLGLRSRQVYAYTDQGEEDDDQSALTGEFQHWLLLKSCSYNSHISFYESCVMLRTKYLITYPLGRVDICQHYLAD